MARMQLCACCLCFVATISIIVSYAGLRAHSLPQHAPLPPPPPHSSPPPPALSPVVAKSNAPLRVPRLIHQSWRDGGFPKGLFNWRWQQGLVDLNEGWKLVKWTDESSRALIAKEYAWFLPTYDAYPSYIQRSDAARYFIIYHHGGVYADLDIECSRPFAPVLADHRAVFSYKVGTNMSRGLVNALFASEARHPLWQTVFTLLTNRSTLGAAAATHVDVVRSTGPGLLREALLQLRGAGAHDADDGLVRHGIALLDASVWHPILAEQKRGRDPSAARAIERSHCYHHFVSSWMTHDKGKHGQTEAQRSEAHGGGNAINGGGGGVPTGQGLREVNPWKSYQVATATVDAGALAAAKPKATVAPPPPYAVAKSEKEVMKAVITKGFAKRKARRKRAMGG